jgi:hypothetical protein
MEPAGSGFAYAPSGGASPASAASFTLLLGANYDSSLLEGVHTGRLNVCVARRIIVAVCGAVSRGAIGKPLVWAGWCTLAFLYLGGLFARLGR